jgi:hypothetical protein
MMDKKGWLDYLYYDIGKQNHDFELTCLTVDKPKQKWRKYLDAQADEKFIEIANNRTIFPFEVVIDLEDPSKYEMIIKRIKKDFQSYSSYNTGSRGYHIHLFFNRELTQDEKLSIINRYEGDKQKASKRTMIALENCPHWKTGKLKELVENDFGYNSADDIDFSKEYFNFDAEPTTIEETLDVIEKNFPGMAFPTECCLSFICALLIKDLSNPLGLNLEGAPSSEKTTILSFFYGIDKITFKSDSFTPKSFVSHSANVKEKDLENIDLLPKIKNKVFLIPELAPIFGKRKEDLVENLSTLTRIFDGEGLETDSGSRGHRGYSGHYLFIWIGAVVTLPNHVWNVMGKLGQRFLFLKIPDKNKTNESLKGVMTDVSYRKKIKDCREVIHNYVKDRFNNAESLFNIEWDRRKDNDELRNLIVSLAKILSSLRAPIEIYSQEGLEEKYQFRIPIKEEPERAISHLYDIARGHAVACNRDYITMDDARVVIEVALSSCPFDRYKLLELFIKTDKSSISVDYIAKSINCSGKYAGIVMKTMEILNLGKIEEINEEFRGQGRPMLMFSLNYEYFELLNKLKELRQSYDVSLSSENNFGSENDSMKG